MTSKYIQGIISEVNLYISLIAKAWGNKKNPPVLVVHGMGDNAGAFDKLIPLLPTTFYYVCVDLPGHGRSSHFPHSLPIHTLNIVFTYKLIADYLKRDKYIIIGHSWGGRTTILFTQLYPETVLKLVLIDPVYVQLTSVGDFQKHVVGQFNDIIKLNNTQLQETRRTYNYAEAFKKTQDGMYGRELDKAAVEALLKRSLIEADSGQFYFTNDVRLKVRPTDLMQNNKLTNDLMKTYPIKCPVLVILATKIAAPNKPFRNVSVIDVMQKMNRQCVVKKVRNDHDVHMKQPEVVATLINSFLNNQSKL